MTWHLDHAVVWALPITLMVYARGWLHLHRQVPAVYPVWRLIAFAGGLAIVFVAVASPIDEYGGVLLLAHMTQHMLLMMVAPPLIWLGQPVVPCLRGLPAWVVKRALGPWLWSRPLRAAGRFLIHPMVCWLAFAIAFTVWHLPPLYELALRSEGSHDVQHACFFTASLLFWWPVIGVWPAAHRWPRWTMIPYLVAADLVNTVLSATLTFAPHVLYPHYTQVPRVSGLSPLDDQALAGVIMWVPGSLAFLLPAVVLTFQLFEPQSLRRASRRAVAARAR